MADKVAGGQQDHLPRGNGKGKRTHQLLLLHRQLFKGQFGDEGHPLSSLHHAHEGLDAPQRIGLLGLTGGRQVTELHQLVAEAMPFVQEPQRLPFEVGGTDGGAVEQSIPARDIDHELLVVERGLHVSFRFGQTDEDGRIEDSLAQGLTDFLRLQFHHPQVGLGMFLAQPGEEPGQQVGSDGGQYSQPERAAQGMLLLLHQFLDPGRSGQHFFGLLYHLLSDPRRHHLLGGTLEQFHPQLGLQFLNHGTQCGLGHPTLFGRLGKMPVAIDRHYVFQLL